MKKILSILAISALMFACNNETKSVSEIKQLTLEELVASSADLKDQTVSFEGMVTHVCKHGGQKMFMTDDGQELSLLVRVSNSIPEFDVALEGSTVQITGKLIATVVEESGEEGHEHAEGEEADCATEEALKAKGEGDACSTNISYHVEATTFKEINK